MKKLFVYIIIGTIVSYLYGIYGTTINQFIYDLMIKVSSLKCYVGEDTITFIMFIIITIIVKAIIYSFYKKAE